MDYASLTIDYSLSIFTILVSLLIFLLDFSYRHYEMEEDRDRKRTWILLSLLCAVGIIYFIFSLWGLVIRADEYNKLTEHQMQPISINMTCIDQNNCTATVPNNMQISCLPTVCPPEKTCPNVTVPPPIIVRPTYYTLPIPRL